MDAPGAAARLDSTMPRTPEGPGDTLPLGVVGATGAWEREREKKWGSAKPREVSVRSRRKGGGKGRRWLTHLLLIVPLIPATLLRGHDLCSG